MRIDAIAIEKTYHSCAEYPLRFSRKAGDTLPKIRTAFFFVYIFVDVLFTFFPRRVLFHRVPRLPPCSIPPVPPRIFHSITSADADIQP